MASDGSEPPPVRVASPSLLLTCEHGGNLVPGEYARLFAHSDKLLASHRGWDPGALEAAFSIATISRAPLYFALVSRLVIDLNRSLDNPTLFSNLTGALPPLEQRRIIERHYTPYRRDVERRARQMSRARPVVHLSVHSFTPVLRGQKREVDIGLLFDPARDFERSFVRRWMRSMHARLPRLRIRANQPYRGTDDGLTTYLRTRLSDSRYAGIELEISQRFPRRGGTPWADLRQTLAETLVGCLITQPRGARRP